MKRFAVPALSLVLLALPACGTSTTKAVDTAGGQIVNVDMRASHFQPASVTVDRGRRVTFRFTNRDQIVHDAFVGDEDAQKAHEKQMREAKKDGHAGHSMAEEGAITVKPGKVGELSYTFNKTGTTLIGCHEPGHYASGMVMQVNVR